MSSQALTLPVVSSTPKKTNQAKDKSQATIYRRLNKEMYDDQKELFLSLLDRGAISKDEFEEFLEFLAKLRISKYASNVAHRRLKTGINYRIDAALNRIRRLR